MNNNSDMEDFIKSINEVLDDLDNMNYSLNYQYTPNQNYYIKIPKDKLNGLPPLHPNIPSYVNKLNKKSTINIQGIAFPPQKKKIK